MRSRTDERVLIVAPVGSDAARIAALLHDHGLEACVCPGPSEAAAQLAPGAGALLMTEEALDLLHLPVLLDALGAQPPWSELPVVIMTVRGESSRPKLLELAAKASGAMTLLERPISTSTLLRSVEVALRSRRRQYQVRDLLQEQHARQEQLRESEERYRSLVSQVKDYAIFHLDTSGRPTSWNLGVKRVLGFEEPNFIGADINSIIFTPEDILAGVPERELRTAAAEGTANNDRWLRRKDGTRFYASGITTALKDSSGQLTGFSKVLRDITLRKQAEQHLEHVVAERTADLRATNEHLEAFLYSIAHDLRAPLRSMAGYSQVLLEDYAPRLDDFGQQMLSRIQSSAEFMDKLIVDLLAYGRTAGAGVELAPVEVKRAWEAARLQCLIQIEESGAEIVTQEPLPVIHAHEITLTQVFANLLSNALKFRRPGTRPCVRFAAEQSPDSVQLCVEDNGIGIPPEQHERVFRVFERLHGPEYPGTGIGLSIVRKGVERMGGKITLESQLGKGTRFCLQFPAARRNSAPPS